MLKAVRSLKAVSKYMIHILIVDSVRRDEHGAFGMTRIVQACIKVDLIDGRNDVPYQVRVCRRSG